MPRLVKPRETDMNKFASMLLSATALNATLAAPADARAPNCANNYCVYDVKGTQLGNVLQTNAFSRTYLGIDYAINYWRNGLWPDADRKSTRLNSSHSGESRMPSSA